MDALYRSILCPTDFSPASRTPLEEAKRLARSGDGRLLVLHVIHETALDEEGDQEMEEFYDELHQKAEERMRELVPEAEGDRITCLVLRGQPVREILRTAVQEDVDLVVIGSHGMTGVEAGPFGSTGRAVVLLCPVPVLVVKPEGYDPRRAAAATGSGGE